MAVVGGAGPADEPTSLPRRSRCARFTALRYFAPGGTDHAAHTEQGIMIRRYVIWRNRHAGDERLRAIVKRANSA